MFHRPSFKRRVFLSTKSIFPKEYERKIQSVGRSMNTIAIENPVFCTYAIAASLMVLKIMGQGWMTVYRMLKSDSGLASPEDLQVGMINKILAQNSWR